MATGSQDRQPRKVQPAQGTTASSTRETGREYSRRLWDPAAIPSSGNKFEVVARGSEDSQVKTTEPAAKYWLGWHGGMEASKYCDVFGRHVPEPRDTLCSETCGPAEWVAAWIFGRSSWLLETDYEPIHAARGAC